MLQRGGNAVRLSRVEWTKVSDGERVGWGTRGSTIPPTKVSLSDIPFAKCTEAISELVDKTRKLKIAK
jgi:hypothetical protein